jgi:hypothetical protein
MNNINIRQGIFRFILGLISSVLIFTLGLLGLEKLVRKIKPQITFSESYGQKTGFFEKHNKQAFTIKKNLDIGWLKTNSLGYRGREVTIEKPKDVYRILVLGDSFVLGVGVGSNDQTFSAVLENELNKTGKKKFEIINAGFHDGFSPDSYYAYLLEEGLKLAPDMVIDCIYLQNDIGDLKGVRWEDLDRFGMPRKVVSEWRRVDNMGRLYDGIPPLRYKIEPLKESHLWILIANWLDIHFPILRSRNEAKKIKEVQNWYLLIDSDCIFLPDCQTKFDIEFRKLKFVLKNTAKLLEEQKIPLLFVFEPSKMQLNIANKSLPRADITLLADDIIEYLSFETKSNYLDLTMDFLTPDFIEFYNKIDTHWNKAGNEKAGMLIADKVLKILDLTE